MSEPKYQAKPSNNIDKSKPLQEKSVVAQSQAATKSIQSRSGGARPVPLNEKNIQQLAPIIGNGQIVAALETPEQKLRKRAQTQWDAFPAAHQFFRTLNRYISYLPMYETQYGIVNPAEYLAKNMVNIDLFGKPVTVHQTMANLLRIAEEMLKLGMYSDRENQEPYKPTIRTLSGLSIRSKRGQDGKLSMHALGLAIDIDAQLNPLIRRQRNHQANKYKSGHNQTTNAQPSKPDEVIDAATIIFEVTSVDMTKTASIEQLRSANDTFRQNFNQAWIEQQSLEVQSVLTKGTSLRTVLDGYAARGFLNLAQPIIDALIDAGLEWGGSWKNSKDFMHFELRYDSVQ